MVRGHILWVETGEISRSQTFQGFEAYGKEFLLRSMHGH